MDKTLERLKTEFTTTETRYAYANSVADAFLTSQVKRLREERGLTQEELAALIGTQQSGISRWLNSGFATCKVETLRKFATAYGVRLWISFETFGTLPSDIEGFTEERLAPPKFEDDPAFREPENKPESKEVAATLTVPGVYISTPRDFADYNAAFEALLTPRLFTSMDPSDPYGLNGHETNYGSWITGPPNTFWEYQPPPEQRMAEVINISMYKNSPTKPEEDDDERRKTA